MTTRPTARDRTLRLPFEVRDMREKLHELHQRAGIADSVERLALPGWTPEMDAPLGSEAERRAWMAEQECQSDRFVRGLRRLYFGVADPELRKEMIRLSRLLEERQLREAWARVDWAREDLAKAKKPPNWPLVAAVAGLAAVYLGVQLASVAGAVGGAVVAFFFGKTLEADAAARQKAAIASAEEVLKSEEGTAQVISERRHIFYWEEAASGEPVADEAG